ncbi:hypothetical protein pb186bvf_015155 [Paramecium bursaria]
MFMNLLYFCDSINKFLLTLKFYWRIQQNFPKNSLFFF